MNIFQSSLEYIETENKREERDIEKFLTFRIQTYGGKEEVIKLYRKLGKGLYEVPRFTHTILETRKKRIKVDRDNFVSKKVKYPPFKLTLRREQKKAIKAYLKHIDDNLLVLPPASGKTILGAKIASELREKTIIVVHRTNFFKVWKDDIQKAFGIHPSEIGEIRGKTTKIGKIFTLATYQTLLKKIETDPSIFEQFGLSIFDECLTYDTVVKTNLGELPIGYIVENKIKCKALTYNEKTKKYEYKPVTQYFEQGERDVIELEFDNGLTLTCTENHPILTKNRGWVEAGELTETDEIHEGTISKYDRLTNEEKEKIKTKFKALNKENNKCVCGCNEIIPIGMARIIDKDYRLKSYRVGHQSNKVDRNLKLTESEKQLIIGSVLGNGTIHYPHDRAENPRFITNHTYKHREYVKDKRDKLSRLEPLYQEKIENKGYGKYLTRITTTCHEELAKLRKLLYRENKKVITKKVLDKLTGEGLSYLVMDKTSIVRKSGRMTFHLEGYTKEDVNVFANWMREKYEIETRLGEYRGFYVLYVKREEAQKLISKLENYLMSWYKEKVVTTYATEKEDKKRKRKSVRYRSKRQP